MSTPVPQPLRRGDYLLLTVYGVLVFGFALWFDRTLTTHETVGCVNVREMRLDGDWVIPHYGGRPWLERPPLPFWITLPCLSVVGDVPLAYRLAPMLVAIPIVWLVAWLAGLWYGRNVGLLAGLAVATIREFSHYATGPECDVFLCGLVTAGLALFAHLEFGPRSDEDRTSLLGWRSWTLLGLFVVLGLANVVKGLFFGDLFILLPIAVFLLVGEKPWTHVRRYVWLPGWLAFAVTASAWATAAYWRYPDIVELWKSDYAGRVNQGYMREPFWYYFAHMPWLLFPWFLPALFGLGLTWRQALQQGRTPERFLWCWAFVPMLFFSVPQGKHHHYMLHLVAPWAVLAALGCHRLWQFLASLSWFHQPWPALATIAVPGEVALYFLGSRLGGPPWFLTAALVLWPVLILALWGVIVQPTPRRAAIALFALLVPAHWAGHAFHPLRDDRYADDRAFLDQVRAEVPPSAKLLVLDTMGPLDASWLLFYLEGRGELLHNATFLRDERLGTDEFFLVSRRGFLADVTRCATATPLFESRRSRDEGALGPNGRFGLYRVRLHEGLVKHRGPVYVSPMQATGRSPGPELLEEEHKRPVARR